MKGKPTLDDEEIRQHEHDFRITVAVIIHELFTHAPSLQNAMDIISIAIQDNISEKDFNKYFKKAFRADPFFAQKERTLH